MNDFYNELTDAIIAIVEEDVKHDKHILRMDIKRLVSDMIAEHDEEVINTTKAMLDEDEVYDDGFEDGYTAGWNEAKEEMREALNDLHISRGC